MGSYIYTPLPPYNSFTAYSPTIPKLYWDVKSQEQRILELCKNMMKVVAYSGETADKTNELGEQLQRLSDLFDKFMESGFDDYYYDQIMQWVDDNMISIMSRAIKNVWFGLTSTGYFCAYVPDSWSDIQFDTGAVYGTAEYGRLILRYNVDGEGVIDNTSPDYASIQQLMADVETLKRRVLRHGTTLYAPTRGDE